MKANTSLKVEHGIAIPPKSNPRYSQWLEIAKKMQVGDSVLCSSARDCRNVGNALWRLFGRSSTLQRAQPGGTIRLWRIK